MMMRLMRIVWVVIFLSIFPVMAFATGDGGIFLTTRNGACWSPDGSKIAFTNTPDQRKGPEEPSIWIVNLKEKTCQELSKGEMPDWSPDGNRLVFVRKGKIYTKDVRTGVEESLLQEAESGAYPAWSPAGDRIAFSGDLTPPGIYILDLKTSQKHLVILTKTD